MELPPNRPHSSRLPALVLALGLCLVPPLGSAKDPAPGDNAKRPPHERLAQELGLNEKQVTQLKAINDKYATQGKEQKTQMKELHEKLNAALKSDTPDAEIRKQHAALQTLKNQQAEQRLSKILEIRAILTKEQRARYEAFKKEHGPRGNHRPKDLKDRGNNAP